MTNFKLVCPPTKIMATMTNSKLVRPPPNNLRRQDKLCVTYQINIYTPATHILCKPSAHTNNAISHTTQVFWIADFVREIHTILIQNRHRGLPHSPMFPKQYWRIICINSTFQNYICVDDNVIIRGKRHFVPI